MSANEHLGPQFEELHRGLHMGTTDDHNVEAMHADPVKYLHENGTGYGKNVGIHWTDSTHSATNFAMNRDMHGWAHEGDEDDEPGGHTSGLILHAKVEPKHILKHGSEEWENYADFNQIQHEDSDEQEKTVREHAPVHITHVTALSQDQFGNERQTMVPWAAKRNA
jgi:hypothetical protein